MCGKSGWHTSIQHDKQNNLVIHLYWVNKISPAFPPNNIARISDHFAKPGNTEMEKRGK